MEEQELHAVRAHIAFDTGSYAKGQTRIKQKSQPQTKRKDKQKGQNVPRISHQAQIGPHGHPCYTHNATQHHHKPPATPTPQANNTTTNQQHQTYSFIPGIDMLERPHGSRSLHALAAAWVQNMSQICCLIWPFPLPLPVAMSLLSWT